MSSIFQQVVYLRIEIVSVFLLWICCDRSCWIKLEVCFVEWFKTSWFVILSFVVEVISPYSCYSLSYFNYQLFILQFEIWSSIVSSALFFPNISRIPVDHNQAHSITFQLIVLSLSSWNENWETETVLNLAYPNGGLDEKVIPVHKSQTIATGRPAGSLESLIFRIL